MTVEQEPAHTLALVPLVFYTESSIGHLKDILEKVMILSIQPVIFIADRTSNSYISTRWKNANVKAWETFSYEILVGLKKRHDGICCYSFWGIPANVDMYKGNIVQNQPKGFEFTQLFVLLTTRSTAWPNEIETLQFVHEVLFDYQSTKGHYL